MRSSEEIERWTRRMLRNMFDRPRMYGESADALDAVMALGLWFWSVVTEQEDEFTRLNAPVAKPSIDDVVAHYRHIARTLGLLDDDGG